MSPQHSLPEHDPTDPVESAVITRLVRNWGQRATVKKPEPDLDELFDRDKRDYPNELLPFADHDRFLGLTDDQQDQLRAWAWIAFNKNVMDIEQYVVNPGFDLVAHDGLDTGLGDTFALAVHQAMVDEQYHTLMHLNASAVTRRQRGWALPNDALPDVMTLRRQREVAAADPDSRRKAISLFAFMTVAEVSISSYLDLISENDVIQPINRATVRLHNRDEYCHSSIADEIAGIVYDTLRPDERRHFLDGLVHAMNAFSSNDYSTWRTIVELMELEGGHAMIDDAEHDTSHSKLVQDFSGIHKLCRNLGVAEEMSFQWT
ncbi:N-oxidase [Rhodococcus sp. WMMA185]|uniref:AurF N-oxygenase family protein n=1 Tax=Rhodococcus sp. WMMA185 TaxID=679318 RepID=UPI0008789168|nr:diiron oxygenase [Rhodococcus sp. WMMA185]AOW92068.1 N-oxidase [Rhodococcus sp. WMMA185]